jgi:hypothetical protein
MYQQDDGLLPDRALLNWPLPVALLDWPLPVALLDWPLPDRALFDWPLPDWALPHYLHVPTQAGGGHEAAERAIWPILAVAVPV